MIARLATRVEGPAQAPALLLAPSIGTDTRVWDAQIPALAARFRVVRFDHRGHGESPSPPGVWTIDDLGADVVALLDELGIARASFVGLSIGGMVGLWLAAHAPERIDRLGVVCTSAYLDAQDAWRRRAATVRADGLAPIVDAVVAKWFTPEFAERRPDVVARFKQLLGATPAPGYAGCCDALATLDLRADLAAVRAPTLVVSAADDLAIRPEHGEAIAQAIAGARFQSIRGAAHIAPVERPEQVTRALLAHLLVKEA